MSELKDSGERREFETGAVRDTATGKGRCDLLPLDVVAELLDDGALRSVNAYVRSGKKECLLDAIGHFVGFSEVQLCTTMLEVSKQYEDGAIKYKERNWELGMPLHSFIDSGVRHYLQHLRGDTDEPHDRAFIWNMLGAIWTHQNKPEMIDLPFAGKDGEK